MYVSIVTNTLVWLLCVLHTVLYYQYTQERIRTVDQSKSMQLQQKPIVRAKFPTSTKNRTLVTWTHSNINILRSLCSVCYYFQYWQEISPCFDFLRSYMLLLQLLVLMRSWYTKLHFNFSHPTSQHSLLASRSLMTSGIRGWQKDSPRSMMVTPRRSQRL